MTDKFEPASLDLVILMPVYNDWDAAGAVIEQVDSALADSHVRPLILLVDDGSSISAPARLVRKPLDVVCAIDVLRLRRNVGHQRAIAVGLTYVFQEISCDATLVMDCDGEDRPEDVPRLVEEFCSAGYGRIIFAERTRRMEGFLFKTCYRCYQILHRMLTGVQVKVGNFSIIPFCSLSALVVAPELWNHYAAAVFRLRLPLGMLKSPRGRRLSGESKMDFVSLVIHGLSAISVFGEVVGTRILAVGCVLSLLVLGVLAAVVAIRLFTGLAVAGWATYSSGLLLLLLVLILTTTFGFLLFVLMNRNMLSFLPLRDSSLYVQDIKRLYAGDK